MKSRLQKEMRTIRIQLKVHDITEEKKSVLRTELEKLRLMYQEEFTKERSISK